MRKILFYLSVSSFLAAFEAPQYKELDKALRAPKHEKVGYLALNNNILVGGVSWKLSKKAEIAFESGPFVPVGGAFMLRVPSKGDKYFGFGGSVGLGIDWDNFKLGPCLGPRVVYGVEFDDSFVELGVSPIPYIIDGWIEWPVPILKVGLKF